MANADCRLTQSSSVAERRKPNSVPAFRRTTIIPLVPSLLTGSSSLPGDASNGPFDYLLACARRAWSPYLALLRAGFCLPSVLPQTRCALTAPFHPYLSARPFGLARGGIFSVPLVLRVAPTGRYPAHCPAEFGLSSRLATRDHPALCDLSMISHFPMGGPESPSHLERNLLALTFVQGLCWSPT